MITFKEGRNGERVEIGRLAPKYRRKPTVVEAFQWHEALRIWMVKDRAYISEMWFDKTAEDGRYYIETPEGDKIIKNGDYIIKNSDGEFYPCKPEMFEKTYEKIEIKCDECNFKNNLIPCLHCNEPIDALPEYKINQMKKFIRSIGSK